MKHGLNPLRELLVADLALIRGIAESRDVAAALQRYWDNRGDPELSLARELARIAGILPEQLAPIEAEVDRLIAAAGGDSQALIESRLGIRQRVEDRASQADARASTPEDESVIRLRSLPAGRYKDFLPAGEGGMGIVYWALDTELNRQVALKVVRPDVGEGPRHETPDTPEALRPPGRDTPASRAFRELKTRFLQEVWITSGLEHPGIVPVYELGQTGAGVPYYSSG